MQKIEEMTAVQSNENKQKVRDIILTQTQNAFHRSTKLGVLSLPSTEWKFEKQMLANDKLGNRISFINGVENSAIRYLIAQNTCPKTATQINIEHIDFDKKISKIIKNKEVKKYNLIWADYCGLPFVLNNGEYEYPHLETFARIVKEAKAPMLYYMTFDCSVRFKGGKNPVITAMGDETCKTMPQAIRNRLNKIMREYGITDKAQNICQIYYRGGKRSDMVTLGFAINICLNLTRVKKVNLNLMNSPKSKVSFAPTTKKGKDEMNAKAVKDLFDAGWGSDDIAVVTKMNAQSVRSILAWHQHPTSFGKVGRKKK